jgi:hypothetical protein
MSDLPSAWVALWNTPASIDWCEHNYNVHDSIAEFYNTLSSFAIAGAGVLGLCLYPTAEVRFQLQYVVILIVGLGSVMFHATLQYHMQLCDELPMVYAMLVSIFTMRNVFNFGSTTWLEVLVSALLSFPEILRPEPALHPLWCLLDDSSRVPRLHDRLPSAVWGFGHL